MPQPTSDAARLLALLDEGASLRRRSFRKVNLATIVLEDRDLKGIDLSRANLALARLVRCDLTGANLAGADLHQSALVGLSLANADLRKVNFARSNLSDLVLDGARLEGACFEHCCFFDNVTFAEDQFAHGGRVGPAARRLDELARTPVRFRTEAVVRLGKVRVYLAIERKVLTRVSSTWISITRINRAPSVLQALIRQANTWGRGQLYPHSVAIRLLGKSPVKDQELANLARAAWCEVFGVAVPKKAAAFRPYRTPKEERDRFLTLLDRPDGVERWNACEQERVELRNFRGVDLSGRKLAGAAFNRLDLGGACLDGADLRKASFGIFATTVEHGRRAGRAGKPCSLKRASLKKADLREAFLSGCVAESACFDDARLDRATWLLGKLRGARFRGADLRGADLGLSDLRGVDFTGARLDGIDLGGAILDDDTLLPASVLPEHFTWKGQGARPT